MPDTVRTLASLQTLLADNTSGDISAQDVRDMLVSTYQLDYSADTSITGTATATIGKWHICTGTTSDYTVTLPAASGNAGKLIGLRMSSALTKLVTIDGNGAELIDGAATRVMWANEIAVLFCDGTGWTKVGGKSSPMICRMRLNANQSINNASLTKLTLNTTDIDNTGSMASTGSNQVTVKRTGKYVCGAKVFYDGVPAAGKRIRAQVHQTSTGGTQLLAGEVTSASVADFAAALISDILFQTAGDVVILAAYHDYGSAINAYGANPGDSCYLFLTETELW